MKNNSKLPKPIEYTLKVNITAEEFGGSGSKFGLSEQPYILVEVDIRSNSKQLEPLIEPFRITPESLNEIHALFNYLSAHIENAQYNAMVKLFQQGRFFALRSHDPRNPRAHKKLIEDWINLVQSIEKQTIVDSLKLKVGRGGSVGKWTPETRVAFLEKYDEALAHVQEWQQAYKDNRKRADWRIRVRKLYPDLPEWIMNNFGLRGGPEPSDLALKYAAQTFGIPYTSYLKRVLIKARKERK